MLCFLPAWFIRVRSREYSSHVCATVVALVPLEVVFYNAEASPFYHGLVTGWAIGGIALSGAYISSVYVFESSLHRFVSYVHQCVCAGGWMIFHFVAGTKGS